MLCTTTSICKIEAFFTWRQIWLTISFYGNIFMIHHHYESITVDDWFLAVSSTNQSVFPRFPTKHTRYMVCLRCRNTRDYSTNMQACGLENGCYALLEELAHCIERNATKYADANQQTRAKSIKNKFVKIMIRFIIWNDTFFVHAFNCRKLLTSLFVCSVTQKGRKREKKRSYTDQVVRVYFKKIALKSYFVIVVIFAKSSSKIRTWRNIYCHSNLNIRKQEKYMYLYCIK